MRSEWCWITKVAIDQTMNSCLSLRNIRFTGLGSFERIQKDKEKVSTKMHLKQKKKKAKSVSQVCARMTSRIYALPSTWTQFVSTYTWNQKQGWDNAGTQVNLTFLKIRNCFCQELWHSVGWTHPDYCCHRCLLFSSCSFGHWPASSLVSDKKKATIFKCTFPPYEL